MDDPEEIGVRRSSLPEPLVQLGRRPRRTSPTHSLRGERDRSENDDLYHRRRLAGGGGGGRVTRPPGSEEPAGSTGSVTSTGRAVSRRTPTSVEAQRITNQKGPCSSYLRGPFNYFRACRRPSIKSHPRDRTGNAGRRTRDVTVNDEENACPTAPRPPTSERAALLAAYDAQLRGVAEVQGAVSWDQSGPLWRALFNDGAFVSYESLAELGSVEAVDRLIADTVELHVVAPPGPGVRVEDPRSRLAAGARRPPARARPRAGRGRDRDGRGGERTSRSTSSCPTA